MLKRSALIIIVLLLQLAFLSNNACTAPDPLVGCTACASGESLALESSTLLYSCSTTANCQTIDSMGDCSECNQGYTLNLNTNTSVYDCSSYLIGCLYMLDSACMECQGNNYYLDSNGTCLKTIIDYCWTINFTSCAQCSDENIVSSSNCSIPSAYCSIFDYTIWRCISCPTGMALHSSGVYCLSVTTNCMVYQLATCLQCQPGYYISNSSCTIDTTLNLYLELIPSTYYLTSISSSTLSICLSTSQYYTNSTCSAITSGIAYCLAANSSTCIECLPTFYLNSSSICRPCSTYSNCLTCDAYNCHQCQPTHYLAVDLGLFTISQFYSSASISMVVTSQCLPCSILGCLYCRNEFRDSNLNSIRCDQCLFGYTLFNHTCYLCPNGYRYDIATLNCTACISNCQYCSNSTTCTQCMSGYYYDSTTGTCSNLTAFLVSPALSSSNVFEVLNRSMPLSSTFIINNQKLLVTSCADTSNGYSCYCPTGTTNTYTSLCQAIPTSLLTATLDPLTLFGTNLTSLTKTTFFTSNLRTMQLLSELPLFSFEYAPADANELISQDQLATYLQIKTNYIRNNPSLTNAQTAALASFVLNRMGNVLDPYTATVLAGPGYYFKYSPAAMETDDTTVVSTTHTAGTQTMVFLLYSSTQSASSIIPSVFVYQNTTSSSTTTLTIKKVNFLASNQQYEVYFNGTLQTSTPSADINGYLTITRVPTSNSSAVYPITVLAATSTAVSQLYSSQRIENIIYRDSFIYILAVIFLYLVFLPMCAICDCVDNKALRRRVERQSDSYQGIQHNKTEPDLPEESHRSDEEILTINYKDFFPIYNIANTERPRRLLKLCLFIVNLQHSVTFLVLVYFNLGAGQPLIAVVLAIPAYICTLIMGYLCGALVINLPGKTKYLINVVTLLYWVLWIALMDMFTSSEYKPYVYTFICIFFILDMVLDLLETLLMYFTIKQQSRQIRLFQALAKWLSYRGYYEFNQMARELAEAREASEQQA